MSFQRTVPMKELSHTTPKLGIDLTSLKLKKSPAFFYRFQLKFMESLNKEK